MKIAIDISQIVYKGTGVAKYTKELVNNLVRIDRENEYILFGMSLRQKKVLTDFLGEMRKLNGKITGKFFPIPQTIGQTLWNRLHMVNIETLIGKVNIYHSSDWVQLPSNAKKVTTVHDLVVYKYPETSHLDIIKTQKRRLYWVRRECDLVLADSLATKNDLVKILSFDPAKIEVVYAGVGKEYSPSLKSEIERVKHKYSLMDDYILTVGTQEPRKNLKRVVGAYNKFFHHPLTSSMRKPIELVVVGKVGWDRKLIPTKYTRCLGFVDEKDMPALYSGAFLFVYPSLYEGFGLPIAEAMACGVPVITSERGSLKEVAGSAALFVDPEDEEDIRRKMTQLFVDNKLRLELINKGKENIAKFRWDETAKKILSSYKKIGA